MSRLETFHQETAIRNRRPGEEACSPSPEEIQRACRMIQATWTEEERERRRRGYAGKVRREFMFVAPLPERFDEVETEDLQTCGAEAR